jgi:gluconolactonase
MSNSMAVPAWNPGSGLIGLVEPAAALERLVSGFQFLEGPAWHAGRQSLVFSDIIGDVIYCWNETVGLSVFRSPSHMANGNTWDREGRLLSCEHATSRVCRTDADGRYEVVASHYGGRELNSPNDIVVRRDNSIYFTDPNSGRSAKYGLARKQELDFQGVFRLDPATGQMILLADDFSKPNGLCFSRDESLLYINDSDRQHIRVFVVQSDGTIANGRIWAETGGAEPGVADGMKIDSQGNLYCCGSGGIHVFDAGGRRRDIIRTPEVAANLAWGGVALTDLFITARTSIYRLRMQVPGHSPFTPAGGSGCRKSGE